VYLSDASQCQHVIAYAQRALCAALQPPARDSSDERQCQKEMCPRYARVVGKGEIASLVLSLATRCVVVGLPPARAAIRASELTKARAATCGYLRLAVRDESIIWMLPAHFHQSETGVFAGMGLLSRLLTRTLPQGAETQAQIGQKSDEECE